MSILLKFGITFIPLLSHGMFISKVSVSLNSLVIPIICNDVKVNITANHSHIMKYVFGTHVAFALFDPWKVRNEES